MNGKQNAATIINNGDVVKVELRDDGILSLEFSRKGGPTCGMEVEGLPFLSTAKDSSDVDIQLRARERG